MGYLPPVHTPNQVGSTQGYDSVIMSNLELQTDLEPQVDVIELILIDSWPDLSTLEGSSKLKRVCIYPGLPMYIGSVEV